MKEEKFWNEEWRRFTLPGMRDGEIYEISNYGRVKHFNKKLNDLQFLTTTNQFKDKSGFEYVNNFKRVPGTTKRVTDSIHRLVALIYCDRPSERHKYVIHKDFNKLNNYSENLKWVTQNELNHHNNINPKVKFSRENRKGNITNSKLTETDVIRLKKKIRRGKNPLYKIAKEIGITHTQLNRIRKGENWGHVKIDDED
ncbi:MAG: hypothetical protein WCX31_16250 [Salinivirgaceae bacterium]